MLDQHIDKLLILDEIQNILQDEFYSYRPFCHRAEADYGRNMSIIFLRS
jgi:hypothetical protein